MDNERISLVVAMLINEVCKHSSNATDAANAASVLGGIYDSAIYNAKSFGAGDLKTTMDIVAASLPVAMKAISNELLSGELAEPIRMFREDNITRFNEEVISAYQTGLTLPPTVENVINIHLALFEAENEGSTIPEMDFENVTDDAVTDDETAARV